MMQTGRGNLPVFVELIFMKYLPKLLFFLYAVVELAWNEEVSYAVLALLLLIGAVVIFQERFVDSLYVSAVSFILIGAAAHLDSSLGVLFGIPVLDLVFSRVYVGLLSVAAVFYYDLHADDRFPLLLVLMGLTGMLAYLIRQSVHKELQFKHSLDEERRLRYELEQTKLKLLHSSREIANIAEVKERNRIAREIHDSVGHRIAGILIHLQAAYKVHSKDPERSLEIVEKSIASLSGAVDLIRDTVHNLKPREILGVEYIQSILDHFSFCAVELKYSGDFNAVPAYHLEIIATNIKEALTNVSRYSHATKVEIAIEANEQFTRLYMKDNGIGCPKIKEGMGLGGMRERIRNIGGSISFSSQEGFIIVCLLPRHERSTLFENRNRG